MVEQKVRRQLEMRNKYRIHAVQTLYDSEGSRFWFLVYNTMLWYVQDDVAEHLRGLDEEGVLKFFRESILPTF